MNEQVLHRLRDVLRRNGLNHERTAGVILLVLVWLRRADAFAHVSLHLSPQQILAKLEDLAKGQTVLARWFVDGGVLGQLNPVDLTTVVDLANQLLDSSPGNVATPTAVALPFILEVGFACDPSLPRLVARLVHPVNNELVYVPWDSTGQFSAALADLGATIAIETSDPPVFALLIGMMHGDAWQVSWSNPLLPKRESEPTYDLAAAFLPLGMRHDLELVDLDLTGHFPERTSSVAVLGIRKLLAITKSRIVVAVQNNLLFSSGAEHSLRKDLLQRGLLRTVIAMPAGLLDGTQVAFSVLVIVPKGGATEVRFINADSQRFKESTSRTRTTLLDIDSLVHMSLGELEGPEAATVPVKVLLDKDAQLQVNRYVLPENVARARALLLASAKTVALEDIATLVRPPLLATERDPSTTEELGDESMVPVFEIGASDLPEFSYISKPGRRVTLDPKVRAGAQFLRPNDIVLIVKGSVGKIGIVSGNDLPEEACVWTASQSAIVVRVHERARIDPRALFVQLRSPLGQEFLRGIVSGATIPLIQLKELRRLPVIVPTRETERQAINALDAEAVLERQIANLRAEQALQAANLWKL